MAQLCLPLLPRPVLEGQGNNPRPHCFPLCTRRLQEENWVEIPVLARLASSVQAGEDGAGGG